MLGGMLGLALLFTLQLGLQADFEDDIVYFVLIDRFDNGDPANDRGGEAGSRAQHGFDPTDSAYYHGGDLAGLIRQLDYIQGLGATALWVNPVMRNKTVQQGSAAYHGYWITDFLNVDPHFGTNDEFRRLVEEAHARGLKVILDIVVNHTADVIAFQEGQYAYRGKDAHAFRDASGKAFDDRDFAYGLASLPPFPELAVPGSFPYTPLVSPGEATRKNPAWLNDPRYYHNRGNSTFSGESSLYGDFGGLDDLFSAQPAVVAGMIAIFRHWLETYRVDGFRVDTAKHVNLEFWAAFGPAMKAAATQAGIAGFIQFGEVFDGDQRFTSEFSVRGGLDSSLDFGLAFALREWLAGRTDSETVASYWKDDDYQIDEDSGPGLRPTFLGNHDLGRWAWLTALDQPQLSESQRLDLLELSYGLLFLSRGQPVIYYGDEQGFVGTGGDRGAREDMLPSQAAAYRDLDLLGTSATPANPNFDPDHPLYRAIATLAAFHQAHPALRRGAHLARSSGHPAVVAFSRIDPDQPVEFLVGASRQLGSNTVVALPTLSPPGTVFQLIFSSEDLPAGSPGPGPLRASDEAGRLTLPVPPLGFAVYRALQPLPAPATMAVAFSAAPGDPLFYAPYSRDGHSLAGRYELAAHLTGASWARVDFFARSPQNPSSRVFLGSDWTPPYRVFPAPPAGRDTEDGWTFEVEAIGPGGVTAAATLPGVTLQSGSMPRHLVVHYRRPGGDYEGWNLQVSGPGLEEPSPRTIPFAGATAFGRFAWVPLADPKLPVSFQITGPGPSALFPAPHTALPLRTPEVWARQGSPAVFDRPDDAAGGLFLHVDSKPLETGSLRLSSPGIPLFPPVGQDDFGALFFLPREQYGTTRSLPLDLSDVSGNPLGTWILQPQTAAHRWLRPGNPTAFPSLPAARGQAVIHYHRPNGDYGNSDSTQFQDFWGLHVWTGASLGTTWTQPLKSSPPDGFGAVFTVPLLSGASHLAYILHRGDTKDPGPDQLLDLASTGQEIWQIAAADPATPYLLTALPWPSSGFSSRAVAVSSLHLHLAPGPSLGWFSLPGRLYFPESSSNLFHWTPLISPVGGTGQVQTAPLAVTSDLFFRIRVE